MKTIFKSQTFGMIVLAVSALLLARNTIVSAQIVNTGDCFTLNATPAQGCIENDLQTSPTPTIVIPTIIIPTIVLPTANPTQGNVEEGNIYDPCVLRCPTAPPAGGSTPTSTPAPTGTPNTGGGSNDGGSNNNSSSSSSSNNGSVQGATTTLAATGVFEDMFMNLVGLAGVALSGLSAVMYAKKS